MEDDGDAVRVGFGRLMAEVVKELGHGRQHSAMSVKDNLIAGDQLQIGVLGLVQVTPQLGHQEVWPGLLKFASHFGLDVSHWKLPFQGAGFFFRRFCQFILAVQARRTSDCAKGGLADSTP